MEIKQKTQVGLTFSNYNNAFNYYFNQYKDLCINITNDDNIISVNSRILSFISDFEYSVASVSSRKRFREEAIELLNDVRFSREIRDLEQRRGSNFTAQVDYMKNYYVYFIKHLNLLSEFVEELRHTFMPNTSIQKKLIKYANNQPFFDTLTQFKKLVTDSIGTFDILNFKKSFNTLLIFYNAYSQYINEKTKVIVDKSMSLILSIYLNPEILNILKKKPNFSRDDIETLKNTSAVILQSLLFILSQINISHSNFDLIPKIERKLYQDMTLI